MNQRHKLCSLHFILVPFGPDLCCSMLLPSSPLLQICDTKLVSPMPSAHLHTNTNNMRLFRRLFQKGFVSTGHFMGEPWLPMSWHKCKGCLRLGTSRDIYGCCKTKWGMKTEGKVHLSLHRLSCHQGAGFEWS